MKLKKLLKRRLFVQLLKQKEDVTLDESFKLYNQGLKIIKDCNQQIETIEKQIKIINEEAQQNV